MRTRLVLTFVVAIAGCSGTPAPRLPITVALVGDPSLGRAIRAASQRAERVAVEVVDLPPATPGFDAAPIEDVLARARALYLSDGDYDGCRDALANPTLIPAALGADRRDLAARILLWRVTCLERSGNKAAATREAQQFAVFDLRPPADVEAASIEAQTLLMATIAAARARPRVQLTITAAARDGAVVIDGTGRCRLPCVVEVMPGGHVLRLDQLGAKADAVTHHVDGPATIELPVIAAEPTVAAGQWHRRFGSGTANEVSSPASVALLRQAIGTKRLALLSFSSGPSGAIFGRLVDEHATLATSRRGLANDGAVGTTANGLLDQLLVDASLLPPRRPPLVRRWWFWTAVAGVATVATLTTYYFVAPRDIEPKLTLR